MLWISEAGSAHISLLEELLEHEQACGTLQEQQTHFAGLYQEERAQSARTVLIRHQLTRAMCQQLAGIVAGAHQVGHWQIRLASGLMIIEEPAQHYRAVLQGQARLS